MQRLSYATVAALLGLSLLSLPVISLAAGTSGPPFGNTSGPPSGSVTGPGGANQLVNPLGVSSFPQLVQKLLQAALVIGIPIAVLFIVWAGFKFILARGNPEALKEARTNLLHTLIGVGIFVGASLIASIIVSTLQQLGATGF